MKTIIFLIISLFSITAFAYPDMTGLWFAPQSIKLLVRQDGNSITIKTAFSSPSTGFVTLSLTGSVQDSAGYVILRAYTEKEVPIIFDGKQCTLVRINLHAAGNVVGERPGRKFHAIEGAALGGLALCPGEEGLKMVSWDLSGVWN
jgi:hypothetical protein